jgi:D-3-phosphoglycerate dehydrogenase
MKEERHAMTVGPIKAADSQRILIIEPIAQEGLDLLRYELPEAQIDVLLNLSPERLQTLIGSYTVLIVGSHSHVTEEILIATPHLKVIGYAGPDPDSIDLATAGRHGVLVVYAQRGTTIAVSEYTFALLLSLARQLPAAISHFKASRIDKSHLMGMELHGKVLGVLGLGQIGMEVLRKARAFGMRVIASDPIVSSERAQQFDLRLARQAEVLQRADFVTLHAPFKENQSKAHTRLGVRELSLLKPWTYLVSCERGDLLDEKALLFALHEGRLAGVALDVFSQEPSGDETVLGQLLAHERVIATPRLGPLTIEAQVRVACEVARQVIAALRGDTLYGVTTPFLPPILPA